VYQREDILCLLEFEQISFAILGLSSHFGSATYAVDKKLHTTQSSSIVIKGYAQKLRDFLLSRGA
jgi:hypothetical protein